MSNHTGRWVRFGVSFVAISTFIFHIIDVKIENARLKDRVADLEMQVQALQSELQGLRDAHNYLLARMVAEGKVSIEEIEPFLPEEEVQELEKNELSLPLPADVDVYFYPSGWMGDGEYGNKYITFIRSAEHIKITYSPGPLRWAGIYWQFPDANWGDEPGCNLREARKLNFWAKGETGTEIVEFKTGGIRSGRYYNDSFVKSLGRIKLSQNWKRYEIDLNDQDLSSVIGAFAWVAQATSEINPTGLTFYLKDIYFE